MSGTNTPAPPRRSPGLYRSTAAALFSLVTPDRFERAIPTVAAVRYREGHRRGVRPLADLYLPEGASGRSALIVHGGGFLIGSRRMKAVRFLTARLVSAGLPVCAVDYRMVFRGGRLADAVGDVGDAVAWWRAHCPERGLSPDGVVVIGISAGGALAALAAGEPEADGLAGMVSVFGIYDFGHLGGLLSSLLPRWLTRSSDPEAWRLASPLHRAMPAVPTLLVHGTDDGLVPVDQAHRLAERRLAADLPTETLIFEGQPHAFLNWPNAAADETADRIVSFVRGGA